MKTILIFLLIIAGCQFSEGDRVKSFIPGTYIKTISQEFSIGNDTLFITLLSQSGNNYQIARHTSYRRIIDGKTLPMQREIEKSTGIYNQDEKVLNETREGKIISFNTEKKELYVGATRYKKISK